MLLLFSDSLEFANPNVCPAVHFNSVQQIREIKFKKECGGAFLPRSLRPCRPQAESGWCCGVRCGQPGEAECVAECDWS